MAKDLDTTEDELKEESGAESKQEETGDSASEDAEKESAESKSDEADSEESESEKKESEKKESETEEEPEDSGEGKKKKRKKKKKDKSDRIIPKEERVKLWKIIVTLVMIFGFTFLTAAVIWALVSWDTLNMDELVWHLKVSMKGVNPGMVWSFVLTTVGSAIILTGLAALFIFKNRKYRNTGKRVLRCFFIGSFAILLTGMISAFFGFNLGPWLRDYFNVSTYIADNYVDPGTVEITFPEKKRNLIVIYLESVEVTFADKEDGGAFPKSAIPELVELAKENECFSSDKSKLNGGLAMPGAVWTMGALVGTTTGLPLKTPLGQNGMSVNDDFFPGVVGIGDILQKEGYKNRLLMGTSAVFGGCELYYTSHGVNEIHDYYQAIDVGRIPEDYYVWWGYEDEKLFDYAREELTELASGDQPFYFSMQTMDTHFEDGHYCPHCKREFGANKYANVMCCSSRFVYSLVRWIQNQDFYENTTIIITGDHPTMDKNFCENVPDDYVRKTYTCIINPAEGVETNGKTRVFTTFDLFPTSLAAIGVKIEGEKLGLGTNLFSDVPTLTESQSVEEEEQGVSCRSKMMERMYKGTYVSPFYGGNGDEE